MSAHTKRGTEAPLSDMRGGPSSGVPSSSTNRKPFNVLNWK